MQIKEYLLENSIPEPNSGCRLWLGPLNTAGYGRYGNESAHVLAYQEFIGPVPNGHIVHHQCKTLICIEPAHLQAFTHQWHRLQHINGNRGFVCKNGHDLNIFGVTYNRFGRGKRMSCRACAKASSAKFRAKGKE